MLERQEHEISVTNDALLRMFKIYITAKRLDYLTSNNMFDSQCSMIESCGFIYLFLSLSAVVNVLERSCPI